MFHSTSFSCDQQTFYPNVEQILYNLVLNCLKTEKLSNVGNTANAAIARIMTHNSLHLPPVMWSLILSNKENTRGPTYEAPRENMSKYGGAGPEAVRAVIRC